MLTSAGGEVQIKLFQQVSELEETVRVLQFGCIDHMQRPVIAKAFMSVPRLFATPTLSMRAVREERDERQTSSATPCKLIHNSLLKFDQLAGVVDFGRIRSAEAVGSRESCSAAQIVYVIKLIRNIILRIKIYVYSKILY